MTDELRDLYATCNGANIRRMRFRIIPLDEVLAYKHFVTCELGYFPFTDENDSNPYCVCCKGPLRGWVVHMMHDNESQIVFRSLSNFLAVISRASDLPKKRYPAQSEFGDDRRTRTPLDVASGLATLQFAEKINDADFANQIIHFGLTLLSENELSEFMPYMEKEWMTRRVALRQLVKMSNPVAVQAVSNFKAELAAFARRSVEALIRAGLDAEVVETENVRIQPGPIWLNLDVWFHERNSAGILDRVVERSRFFVAREQARGRGVW